MRARILNLTFGTHALNVKGQKATFLSLVACESGIQSFQGECKSWTLDSGLDHGLDYGLEYGLNPGLIFKLLAMVASQGLH